MLSRLESKFDKHSVLWLLYSIIQNDNLRELEWHFGTKLGRQELVSQAKYQRLVIVYLNRAHTYENLDTILAELSPKIIELAPKGLDTSYKVLK